MTTCRREGLNVDTSDNDTASYDERKEYEQYLVKLVKNSQGHPERVGVRCFG